jgi:hypothetical protein
MDYKLVAISTLAVYGTLLIAGTIISLLSSQFQCSKVGVGESFKQGAIFGVFPTITYAIAAIFLFVRKNFSNTLQGFGIPEEYAPVMGVGYLVMLACWISVVSVIHNTAKAVCNPDVNQMSTFKKNLLAKIAAKEREIEAQKS